MKLRITTFGFLFFLFGGTALATSPEPIAPGDVGTDADITDLMAPITGVPSASPLFHAPTANPLNRTTTTTTTTTAGPITGIPSAPPLPPAAPANPVANAPAAAPAAVPAAQVAPMPYYNSMAGAPTAPKPRRMWKAIRDFHIDHFKAEWEIAEARGQQVDFLTQLGEVFPNGTSHISKFNDELFLEARKFTPEGSRVRACLARGTFHVVCGEESAVHPDLRKAVYHEIYTNPHASPSDKKCADVRHLMKIILANGSKDDPEMQHLNRTMTKVIPEIDLESLPHFLRDPKYTNLRTLTPISPEMHYAALQHLHKWMLADYRHWQAGPVDRAIRKHSLHRSK